MTTDTPQPGSPEAVKFDCKCPVLDNAHGKGYMGCEGVYVRRGDCPLHGFEKPEPETKEEPK